MADSRMANRWKRWEASPFDLAVFRLVVCGLCLAFTDVDHTVRLAQLPAALRVAETSLAFPLAGLPIDPAAVWLSGVCFHVACALALIGIATRPALVVATVVGSYFLGVTQHLGAVVHHHHLLWFLAVLAASPCADVLSIDAARRAAAGAPRPAKASLHYGVPVWTARLLIVVIFFFPGVWKLREAGLAWAWSDNLRNQIYWKWYEHGVTSWRVDRYPTLVRGLALGALAFELTIAAFMFWRRARPFVALWGLGFHLATQLILFIRFTSLWPCYVVILDAARCLRALASEASPSKVVVEAPAPRIAALRSADIFARVIYRPRPRARVPWPALVLRHPVAPLVWLASRWPSAPRWRARSLVASLGVGGVLLAANITAGVTGRTQAWPFACYPTFQWPAADRIPHLAVDARVPDGSWVSIPTRPRSQKAWGLVWSAIGVTHGAFDVERLRAYWATCQREQAWASRLGATHLRFFRAYSSVVPERAEEPPLRRELLYEALLDGTAPDGTAPDGTAPGEAAPDEAPLP